MNISDAESCSSHLKRNEAAGHDNITNEHFIYGESYLTVLQFISLYSLFLWFVRALYL